MRLSALVLLACMTLTGCYESSVPIDLPQHGEIDMRLLGRWVWKPKKPADCDLCYTEMDVHTFNEREYYVETRDYEPYAAVKTTRYRAFSSLFMGRTFFNLQPFESSSNPAPYTLGAYDIKDQDNLTVSLVNDDAVKKKFQDSKSLRRYFQKHAKDKDFFLQETLQFKRAPDKK